MDKLLIITGPTAAGKTTIAVSFAHEFGGELVSADSRQVYRGMDIATGKDRTSIDVPIHAIDIADPQDEFSVSHWISLAQKSISDIHNRKKLPIVVGGTGFYISALLHPPQSLNIPPNLRLRTMMNDKTREQLQNEVKQKLPDVWKFMNDSDRQNKRRLMRKLEIGKSLVYAEKSTFDTFVCGLAMPYPELYAKIDRRVDERVEAGVLDEIQRLLEAGVSFENPSMATLGYREWKQWFENKTEENKRSAIQKWKWDEHAYARRQMTYMKKISGIRWYHPVQDIERLKRDVDSWYTIGKV